MKISTAVELCGFVCFSVAAFVGVYAWRLAPGFVVTGGCLLLIGYGTEDRAAALAVGRILDPWQRRLMMRRAKKVTRKAAKNQAERSR